MKIGENGVLFSGGDNQRTIAFRVLLRIIYPDPDEATSALPNLNVIQSALDELTEKPHFSGHCSPSFNH